MTIARNVVAICSDVRAFSHMYTYTIDTIVKGFDTN